MVTRGLCFCDVIRRIALFNSPFDDKLVVLKINSYQNTHERKKTKHMCIENIYILVILIKMTA